MVLEICPSTEIYLAKAAPFNTVTLTVVRHDETGSHDVPTSQLSFELDREEPADGFLDDGDLRLELATGRLTVVGSSTVSYVRVTCEQAVDGVLAPFSVAVRVVVYDGFREIWIGNPAGRLMAGTDSFVPTILAESSDDDPVAVDITGHGFVRLSLDQAVDGCSVDPVTGRVTAGIDAAGQTLLVNVERVDDGVRKGQLPVLVTAARDERPNEDETVKGFREIIEELPFEPSEVVPRRNILLVAEGFAHADEHEFRSFALKLARRLRKRRVHEPFRMLRNDYRIWVAFAESTASGVTITTRVDRGSGELKEADGLTAPMRLLQAHDTPFGLAYGRRASDVSFAPVPPKKIETPPPEGDGGSNVEPGTGDGGESPSQPTEVVRTPEEEWKAAPREPRQMMKDGRRLCRNRSRWNESSIEWLASLRTKGATPDDDPHYRIGETWGPGGVDQGLVLVIGNAEINAGRYEPGDPDHDHGYLFGTVSLGQEKSNVKLYDGEGPRLENRKSTHFGSGGYNAKMARALVAIHELAHAIFLGDEYEDVHEQKQTDQKTVFNYDNVDSEEWMGTAGQTKWSLVPRVSRSATLAEDASAVNGHITVVLRLGEGAQWIVNADAPVAVLQTRNINWSSAYAQLYGRYPSYRAHAPLQAPLLLGPTADAPDAMLRVTAKQGDRLVLSGDVLTPEMFFPAGSMLFAPAVAPGPDGKPLSLVLPGVLAYMEGTEHPLTSKGGVCGEPNKDRTTRPSVDAERLAIVPPAKYQQVIGLYEGGGTFNCDVYRPTGECMMRTQFELKLIDEKYVEVQKIPFCHVCRYTIVQEFNPSRHAELDLLYPGRPIDPGDQA